MGIGGRRNGAMEMAAGSSGGVSTPGSASEEDDGRSPKDYGREPMVVELEEEFSSSSASFLHNALRVKGIIPSTLHPVMLCFRLKAIYHAGLKHLIICS